jgi:prepilin signal peptidase PulO-like enzyme (type II secretory pathway)
MIGATLVFLAFSVSISIIDIRSLRIPDILTFAGCACLLLYDILFAQASLVSSIIGALVIFTVFFLVRKITNDGLGFGDVKYSVLCGLYCGFPVILVAGALSAFFGLCWYGLLVMRNGKESIRRLRIPFAPFLSVAALCAVFFFGQFLK